MTDRDVEIARITITRTITGEPGEFGDLVNVETSDNLIVIEALGMLRLAEDTLLNPPED